MQIQMSEAVVAHVENRFRKRNLRAAGEWILAAGVGALLAVLRYHGPIGLAGGLLVLYGLHAAYEFFRGAALDAEGASFPRALVPFAPLIVFGRAKIVYPL